MNLFARISIMVAGASPKAAQKATSGDRIRLVLVGISPLIPALSAYFAGGLAFKTFADYSAPLTWGVVGPSCFMFILLVEIVLNTSLNPTAEKWTKIRAAIPRVFLALLISMTLAVPLKLAVFSGPINEELREELGRKVRIAERLYGVPIDSLRWAQEQLDRAVSEKALACGGLRRAYLMEADGTGGSRELGPGEIYELKREAWEDCTKEFDELSTANAKQKIHIEKAIREAQQEKAAAVAGVQAAHATDLVARLRALKTLARKDGSVMSYGIVIFLLLVTLDLLPTLIKLASRFESYRQVEETETNTVELQQQAIRNAWKRIAPEQAETLIFEMKLKEDEKQLDILLAAVCTLLNTITDMKGKVEGLVYKADVVGAETVDLQETVDFLREVARMTLTLKEEILE